MNQLRIQSASALILLSLLFGCDPSATTRLVIRQDNLPTAVRVNVAAQDSVLSQTVDAIEKLLEGSQFTRSATTPIKECQRASVWHRETKDNTGNYRTSVRICMVNAETTVSIVDYFRFSVSEPSRKLSREIQELIQRQTPDAIVKTN